MAEFYMPLVFYLFAWLFFFMTIPRSWTPIEMQGSIDQQNDIAAPAATSLRFKVAGILSGICYLVILYNLSHSLHYYKPRKQGRWAIVDTMLLHVPPRLLLSIAVLGVKVAYTNLSAWEWKYSLMKYNGDAVWPYALGYGPCLLIIIILNVWGLVDENEDLQLIVQRRIRGRAVDDELGLTRKPAWWQHTMAERYFSPEQRLRALAAEVPQGNEVELAPINWPGKTDATTTTTAAAGTAASGLRDRSRSRPPQNPFRDVSPPARGRLGEAAPALGRDKSAASVQTTGSAMTGTTLNAQPQKIRSMLDV